MNLGLRNGATVVTMPRFDLDQFLSLIAEHRVTLANVVPPIALALAKHPAIDDADLSSLRLIMSGAAPLGAELSEAVATRLDVPDDPGLRDDRDEPGDPRLADRAGADQGRLDRPARSRHRVARSSIPRAARTAPAASSGSAARR